MENPENRLEKAFLYLRKTKAVKFQKDVAAKMGVAPNTVSRALAGIKPFYNPSFVKGFNSAFDNIFNEAWLMGEDVPMLALHQPEDKKSETDIIDLAASLIKEAESLRKILTEEVDRSRQLQQELLATLTTIQASGTYIQPEQHTPYLAEKNPTKT